MLRAFKKHALINYGNPSKSVSKGGRRVEERKRVLRLRFLALCLLVRAYCLLPCAAPRWERRINIKYQSVLWCACATTSILMQSGTLIADGVRIIPNNWTCQRPASQPLHFNILIRMYVEMFNIELFMYRDIKYLVYDSYWKKMHHKRHEVQYLIPGSRYYLFCIM